MNLYLQRSIHLAIPLTAALLTVGILTSEPSSYEANWPNWRGPDHRGVAATGAPLRWSETGNVKWKAAIPGKGHSTPVIWGEKLFLTTAVPVESPNDPAVLTSARIVAHKYQQRLPQPHQFKASPTAADERLYLASEAGDVIVLKMGKTYEVLATNKMPGQTFIASPVVAGGDLYLRSQDTLYCIRESN